MTKSLRGKCSECGGDVEFPAEMVGTTAECPHCGKPTELLLAEPPPDSTIRIKTIIYTSIAILILLGGLVAAIIALKRAERVIGRNPPPSTATTPSSPQNK